MACGEEQSYLQIYGYGTIAIVIISLASLVGALTFPFIRKRVYQYTMLFFMALAVGTLAGDATMHLIPMVFSRCILLILFWSAYSKAN